MTIATTPSPRKTEAWGPKLKVRIRHSKSFDSGGRPLTATLERPMVLDVALLDKLDMTTFTKKGLLTIINLCGMSLTKKCGSKVRQKKQKESEKRSKVKRIEKASSCDEESVDVESKVLKKTTKLKTLGSVKMKSTKEEDSWADEETSSSELKIGKRTQKLGSVRSDRYLTNNLSKVGNGNRGILKISRSIDEVFGGPVRSLVPEPCKTCGRPNQPERFHSHPKVPVKNPEKMKTAKTAISKPMPAKFKSAEKMRREKVVKEVKPSGVVHLKIEEVPRGRPRTVTCYLCAREFGTASFPLHEPKCIEKWERENAQLPVEMRRKLPEKPSGDMSLEAWNNFAWTASQASLVPCDKCGRTFNPDRIQPHLRACKGTSRGLSKPDSDSDIASSRPTTAGRPRTVLCYICGREFGTQSINIHEPQCLKKWHWENDQLPPGRRRPEPVRSGQSQPDPLPDPDPEPTAPLQNENSPHLTDSQLKFVTGCFVCGAQMSAKQRMDHEDECIKRWRAENSRRPLKDRLPEPQRPDYRFTASGQPDNEGTFHSIWANHMDSLIPCNRCGRKFFPDRIERHEECCNNQPVQVKKSPRK